MKKKILRAVSDLMSFIGIMTGLVIMMCETPDEVKQSRALVIGLLIFIVSAVPVIVKSSRGSYQDDAEAD